MIIAIQIVTNREKSEEITAATPKTGEVLDLLIQSTPAPRRPAVLGACSLASGFCSPLPPSPPIISPPRIYSLSPCSAESLYF